MLAQVLPQFGPHVAPASFYKLRELELNPYRFEPGSNCGPLRLQRFPPHGSSCWSKTEGRL